MLPEERQIARTLNPWLKLSFCDRDWHRSLYIKSFWDTTDNRQNGGKQNWQKWERDLKQRRRGGHQNSACNRNKSSDCNPAFTSCVCRWWNYLYVRQAPRLFPPAAQLSADTFSKATLNKTPSSILHIHYTTSKQTQLLQNNNDDNKKKGTHNSPQKQPRGYSFFFVISPIASQEVVM